MDHYFPEESFVFFLIERCYQKFHVCRTLGGLFGSPKECLNYCVLSWDRYLQESQQYLHWNNSLLNKLYFWMRNQMCRYNCHTSNAWKIHSKRKGLNFLNLVCSSINYKTRRSRYKFSKSSNRLHISVKRFSATVTTRLSLGLKLFNLGIM